MEELTEVQINHNKAIRGVIIRSLVKGFNNTLYVKQITNMLVADFMILTPDIGKYLAYLVDSGYIEFVNDKKTNAYNAYMRDGIIRLTRKGVDLVEGTIEDPGVDI